MAHHDGDKHNTGNHDGSIKENDGVHNDGNEGSVGNDVDEVNDGDIDNDGENRFICTSYNHRGPCGWKIAHGCIFKDHEVPIQCQPSQCKVREVQMILVFVSCTVIACGYGNIHHLQSLQLMLCRSSIWYAPCITLTTKNLT